jgi:hypothetical protein
MRPKVSTITWAIAQTWGLNIRPLKPTTIDFHNKEQSHV